MQKHKLLVFLAVWRRPEITEICFMGIDRLRKYGLFPIEALAVISEESMIPLCEKYGIGYCFYKNMPVGEKKNFGLSESLKLNWDYMVEIGSDDLLKNEYLEVLKYHLENIDRDILCIDTFVYMNSEDLECRLYSNKSTFGVGRVISRKCIEKLEGKIWADRLNRGLDNNSTFFLARHGFLSRRMKSEKPLAIDIKGPDNIWAFNKLIGHDYSFEETVEGLSEQEITAIKALQCVTV